MKDESTSKKNKKIIAILVSFGFITAIIGGVAIFALSSNMPIQSDFSEANNQIHDVPDEIILPLAYHHPSNQPLLDHFLR